ERVESLPVIEEFGPARAVARVAGDGMTDVREVNPYLVGAARRERKLEKGKAFEGLEHSKVSDRLPPPCREHRHSLAMTGVAPDGRVDRARGNRWYPVNDGQVLPAHPPLFERLHQSPVGGLALGDHHQPRGLLVQTVHDPRLPHAAN